jgi:hypothetical protein
MFWLLHLAPAAALTALFFFCLGTARLGQRVLVRIKKY